MNPSAPNDPLRMRDHELEREFLSRLTRLEYALLQPDWVSSDHGDLDLVVSALDWPTLVSAVIKLSGSSNSPIVKAYEIERGSVSMVMLGLTSSIHIDAAITPNCNRAYGLDLCGALARREPRDGVYTINQADADLYESNKSTFKASRLSQWMHRIGNMPILVRRVVETSVFFRGGFAYIPYIVDPDILRSDALRTKTRKHLESELMFRYSAVDPT